jgi:hypothetical protein
MNQQDPDKFPAFNAFVDAYSRLPDEQKVDLEPNFNLLHKFIINPEAMAWRHRLQVALKQIMGLIPREQGL